MPGCGVCQLHGDDTARQRYEISRSPLWILRHHPDPAPLPGWLLLDTRRLHLHLIPRCGSEPATEAWRVADLYRAVAQGGHPPADPEAVQTLVERARQALLTSAL